MGNVFLKDEDCDDERTEEVKNDGSHCIYCGLPTVPLNLLTSVSRYCPPCEDYGLPQKPPSNTDSMEEELTVDDILGDFDFEIVK